jgi:hypothetical protein
MELHGLLVDAREGAELVNISERAFHTLRAEGKLPPAVNVFGPKRPRWRRDDLIAWVRDLPAIDGASPEPERLTTARSKRG